MKKLTKVQVQHGLRWAMFGLAALTMSVKIAEVSAYNTLQVHLANPEVSAYSTLVSTGYLPM
jgi:hypothetical protein